MNTKGTADRERRWWGERQPELEEAVEEEEKKERALQRPQLQFFENQHKL